MCHALANVSAYIIYTLAHARWRIHAIDFLSCRATSILFGRASVSTDVQTSCRRRSGWRDNQRSIARIRLYSGSFASPINSRRLRRRIGVSDVSANYLAVWLPSLTTPDFLPSSCAVINHHDFTTSRRWYGAPVLETDTGLSKTDGRWRGG